MKRNYVVRPWTEEEEEDFQRFCESIGQMPEDTEWAALMEDGEWGEFFNNDPWWDVELPRA
jgi:hypothetical protein